LSRNVIGLLDDSVDSGALDAFGRFAQQVEDLLQALDLVLCLTEVRIKPLLELRVRRLLDHDRQRLRDLIFGVVNILQRVQEEVVKVLDIVRKQTHGRAPKDDGVGDGAQVTAAFVVENRGRGESCLWLQANRKEQAETSATSATRNC